MYKLEAMSWIVQYVYIVIKLTICLYHLEIEVWLVLCFIFISGFILPLLDELLTKNYNLNSMVMSVMCDSWNLLNLMNTSISDLNLWFFQIVYILYGVLELSKYLRPVKYVFIVFFTLSEKCKKPVEAHS